MNRKKHEWQIGVLFSAALFLSQLSFFAQRVVYLKSITDYIEYLSLGIYLLVIMLGSLHKKIGAKKLFILVCLSIIGVIVCYVAKASAALYFSVLILSAHALSAEKIIKTDLYVKIVILGIICFSSVLGLTDDSLMYRDGIARPSFGFAHPNHLGYILAIIYVDYVLIRKTAVRNTVFSIIMAASMIGVCQIAGSRTPLYIYVLLVPVDIFRNKAISLFRMVAKYPVQFIPIVFLFLTIITTFAYDAKMPFAVNMNEIMSDRLSLQSYYLNNRTVRLFGEKVTKYLDNGYLRIFYNYGILAGSVMLLYVVKAIKVLKDKKQLIAIVLIILSVYALSEHHPFMFNTTPLWAIGEISKKNVSNAMTRRNGDK